VPGRAWARPAVDERLVVAGTVGAGAWPGSRGGSLVGIDRLSGAVRWLHLEPPSPAQAGQPRGWGFAAGPLIVDGVVYAADLEGRVYAMDGT